MKYFNVLIFLAFICAFASCEKAGTIPLHNELTQETIIENEIPYTTLAALSPGFRFVIPSLVTIGSKVPEAPEDFPYMAIINDRTTYLREIHSLQEYPAVDFSIHTLLAIGLETRGNVKVKPIKDGNKIILKVLNEIPIKGPQGAVPRFFSVIIPRADVENISIEIKVSKVE